MSKNLNRRIRCRVYMKTEDENKKKITQTNSDSLYYSKKRPKTAKRTDRQQWWELIGLYYRFFLKKSKCLWKLMVCRWYKTKNKISKLIISECASQIFWFRWLFRTILYNFLYGYSEVDKTNFAPNAKVWNDLETYFPNEFLEN